MDRAHACGAAYAPRFHRTRAAGGQRRLARGARAHHGGRRDAFHRARAVQHDAADYFRKRSAAARRHRHLRIDGIFSAAAHTRVGHPHGAGGRAGPRAQCHRNRGHAAGIGRRGYRRGRGVRSHALPRELPVRRQDVGPAGLYHSACPAKRRCLARCLYPPRCARRASIPSPPCAANNVGQARSLRRPPRPPC